MAKTANLYARIEPDLKEQAEGILTALGIPASNAITMFYKQIILHKGLPFDVKLPEATVPDISRLSDAELDAETPICAGFLSISPSSSVLFKTLPDS